MDNLRRFLEESSTAPRIALPSCVVIRRLKLSPRDVGVMTESATFTPSGDEVCELEVGGVVVARGKMVRKRGESWFKVTEMAKGEKT